MATAYTEWTGSTVGAVPDGWTAGWANTGQWTYQTTYVRASTATAGWARLSWDAPGALTDCEIVTKAHYTAEGTGGDQIYWGSGVRTGGTSGAKDGYVVDLARASGTKKLQLYVFDAGASTLLANIDKAHIANTDYLLRLQVIGTAIKVRLWEDGTSEPGTWDIEVTDASLASGGISLINYGTITTEGEVRFAFAGYSDDPSVTSAPVEAAAGPEETAEGVALLLGDASETIGTGVIVETAEGIELLLGDATEQANTSALETASGILILLGDADETIGIDETAEGTLLLLGDAEETQIISSTLSDTANASDTGLGVVAIEPVLSDTADATATLATLAEFLGRVTDSNLATDTALGIGEFPLAYTDTVDAVDGIALVFLLQYADEGDVSDELVLTFLLAFRELVSATDTLAYTGEYPLSLSSTGSVTDALSFVFPLYLESTADGTDTLDLTRLLALVSTAQAQDSTLSTLELVLALSTLAHAQDAIDWARLSELSDTGEATGDVAAMVTAAVQLADAIDATDGTAWTLALFVNLADTAVGTDTSTVTVEALVSLLSSGHATDFVLTLDDTQERYTGRVTNTETGALSWYTNVPFESLAWDTHTKNLFALKSDGLYVFDADDDAGTDIDATVTTGVLDFQTDLMKRIDSAFIGYAGGSLLLQVHTTMGGTKQTHTYQMVPLTADVPRENVIKIGKGLKFSYCQFTLKNVDGADFELDRMTVYPVTLSRRRYS